VQMRAKPRRRTVCSSSGWTMIKRLMGEGMRRVA
jgi:hypothetical protein